jgi:hypothetical protein
MSAKSKKRQDRSPQPSGVEPVPSRRGWLYPFLLGSAVTGVIVFAATHNAGPVANARLPVQPTTVAAPKYATLGELCEMSDDELRHQDIAVLNLRCAERLPGSDALDIPKCVQTLNEWADHVRSETNRHLYRVNDPKFAKEYHKSESYFRASMMLQVLQEDRGVHYNKERITNVDFKNSRDLFIHGMVGSENGGTCVSMPVLYTA